MPIVESALNGRREKSIQVEKKFYKLWSGVELRLCPSLDESRKRG